MLKKLEIQNFQSYKHAVLEFDPNVTAIIGLNNYGKSAILKALRKTIRDDPNGNVFIRNIPDVADKSKLTVTTSKGVIERVIGRSNSTEDNFYKIITSEGEEFKYVKFSKTGIPKEVIDISEISLPQSFGGEEYDINFQRQTDNAFLVIGKGLSSIRSNALSKVTGIDVAQKAIQIGRLKERNIDQEIKKVRKEKERLNIELTNYVDLDNITLLIGGQRDRIKRLLSLENDIEYFKTSFRSLSNIITTASNLRGFVKNLEVSFDITVFVTLRNKLNFLKKLQSIILSEDLLINKIDSLKKKIDVENLKSLLYKKTLLIQLLLIKKDLENLESVNSINVLDLSFVYNFQSKLKNIILLQTNINNNFMLRKENAKKIDEIHENYEEAFIMLEEFRKELGVCPTCGEPFKRRKLDGTIF